MEYYYDGSCGPEHPQGRLTAVAISGSSTDFQSVNQYFLYSYDSRGNVTMAWQEIFDHVYQTTYGYDQANNLLYITYPSGRIVNYFPQPNDPSRVGQVQIALSGTGLQPVASNIAYDPFGDVKSLTYGNGLELSIQKNQRSAHAQISLAGGQTFLSVNNYTYDSAGNITSILNELDPTRDQSFSYDPLNQLTDADGPYGTFQWNYDPIGNRTVELMTPPASAAQTTDYFYTQGTNRLESSITEDPPVSASFQDYVLTLIYPKHHLPQGQPLQEQYWDLLDELERLLDRADAGKKNVYLAPFLAHLRVFLNHAQLNKSDTIRSLLVENGVPAGMVSWLAEEKWWNLRKEDLSRWTQDQRDDLRIWLDLAGMIQIVALEADPVLNERWYSYDPAGSLEEETVLVFGADPTERAYLNNDNSHLEGAILAGEVSEFYAYDHLNRRVVKEGPSETLVYHYDLQGNLIAESNADGEILREWVYVNGQRLAMILPAPGGGGGGGCEAPSRPNFPSCSSLAARPGADAGAGTFLLLLGPAFIVIGLKYHRRKYTIVGLTFIGGMLFLVLMPQAQSPKPNSCGDHLLLPQ